LPPQENHVLGPYLSLEPAVHREGAAEAQPENNRRKPHIKKARVEVSSAILPYPKTASGPSVSDVRDRLRDADADFKEFKANIVYNAPAIMELNKPTDIELIVGTRPMVALKAELKAIGEQVEVQTKITKYVQAVLSGGNDFDIKPLTSKEQQVRPNDFAQWWWRVTPRVPGNPKELDLVVSELVSDGLKEDPNTRVVRQSFIDVIVPPAPPTPPASIAQRWIGENWKWACTTIVFPLVVWLWKQWQERKLGPPSKRRRAKLKKHTSSLES
jgi:hypothetical protein